MGFPLWSAGGRVPWRSPPTPVRSSLSPRAADAAVAAIRYYRKTPPEYSIYKYCMPFGASRKNK